jgi:hypothetical protein
MLMEAVRVGPSGNAAIEKPRGQALPAREAIVTEWVGVDRIEPVAAPAHAGASEDDERFGHGCFRAAKRPVASVGRP